MVYPQPPPQQPFVAGTRTPADVARNAETDAHNREDEFGARARAGTNARPIEPRLVDRLVIALRRLLGRTRR
jgi:hypothetical protein